MGKTRTGRPDDAQLELARDLRDAGYGRAPGACPDGLSLSRLATGELAGGDALPIERHLMACSACSADVEDLAGASAKAGKLPVLRKPRQGAAVPGVANLLERLRALVRVEMPLSVALVARGAAARSVPRFEMAMRVYREGSFERALAELEAALAQGESGAALHFYLGALYLNAGRADDAAAHCASAVKAEPKRAAYRWLLAQALLACGRGEEAAAELARVARLPGPHGEQAKALRRELLELLGASSRGE